MACTLSFSTSRYVVQVGDRRPGSAPPDSDPSIERREGSEGIVFLAADGAVSIGYAGAARVDGRRTDQWLAELLWGAKTKRGYGIAGQAATTRVSEALYRVRRSLADMPAAAGLELLVSGFRCKSGRWVPVNVRVRNRAAQRVQGLRRLRLARSVVASAVGDAPTLPEFATALRRMSNPPRDGITADAVAAMLGGLVRTVAARNTGVGVDLVTTILHPPEIGLVECRLSSLYYGSGIALQKLGALSLGIPRLLPLGHAESSPWVIGQQAVRGPSMFYGGEGPTVQADGYTVRVESGRPEPLIAASALRSTTRCGQARA